MQVRLPASCSQSCGVRLQASLSRFSVTPAGGSAGAWIRTAWSSTAPDKRADPNAVNITLLTLMTPSETSIIQHVSKTAATSGWNQRDSHCPPSTFTVEINMFTGISTNLEQKSLPALTCIKVCLRVSHSSSDSLTCCPLTCRSRQL